MSRPDLTALALLVAVTEHGSVSAAARALGTAQPNASRSLARLERQLGLTLLRREPSGTRLTPNGLLVAEWARAVVVAADELSDGARSLAATTAASLRVAASQTVAEHLLPLWLAALRRRSPGVDVHVTVANTTAVIAAVTSGACDVGFVEGPGSTRSVRHRTVARDELVLIVPPDHRWARRRRPVSPAELADTDLVVREPGSGTRTSLDRALGRPARVALELTSNAAVRVAVAAGTGPAVLSRLAVADALAAGAVVEVPVSGLDLARRLAAVWSASGAPTPAARELITIAHARR